MGSGYVWQRAEWPNFTWDSAQLLTKVGQARSAQGRILAQGNVIGLAERVDLLVEEAFATSEIEGENLDRRVIRSSVAQRLGVSQAGLPSQVRHVDGLVHMLVDATSSYQAPLTEARLHSWHAGLFPTGYSGWQKIQVGQWRSGEQPMQVLSGQMGQETVHFEAHPSVQVPQEMERFLRWWNEASLQMDGLIRAGIAHFWFVTIHPYEDGNGRISRAITDMALSQDEQSGRRLYNLSTQIGKEKQAYYDTLEGCQKSTCDITPWLDWFLGMYTRAIATSEGMVEKAFMISRFWNLYGKTELNTRQVKVIQKLLEAEPVGFIGGLSNRNYVSMTHISPETAKRDLADLEKKGILKRNSGQGRSTSYSLNKEKLGGGAGGGDALQGKEDYSGTR